MDAQGHSDNFKRINPMQDSFTTVICCNHDGEEIPDVKVEIKVDYYRGRNESDDPCEIEIISVTAQEPTVDQDGRLLWKRGDAIDRACYDPEALREIYMEYRQARREEIEAI